MQAVFNIKGLKEVDRMLAAYDKRARRALEKTLDQLAVKISGDERAEMKRVFSNPVAYTLNSLKVTKTKGHNMVAKVGLKDPPRMQQHYLVPEVLGGQRKEKGFELAVDPGAQFDLSKYARRTGSGDISVSQAKEIVRGVKGAGREYFYLKHRHGRLLPGVYQRVKTGKGFGKGVDKASRRVVQRGQRRGRFTSAILARGIKPILIRRASKQVYRDLFKFYEVAARACGDAAVLALFQRNLGL